MKLVDMDQKGKQNSIGIELVKDFDYDIHIFLLFSS